MAIYATVDGAGNPTGFYDDAVHAAIPSGAVELTRAQYQQWLAAQGTVVWTGSSLGQAPAPAPTVAAALAALDKLRQKKQALGVMFTPSGAAAPARFATDDASQAKLLAEFVAASSPNPAAGTSTTLRGGTGPWRAADGSYVTLTDADVKALAAEVRSYIVACYAREQALAAAVAANPATDITAGWPPNT